MVMLPPEAVTVPDKVEVVATTTLPKASELGLAFSCGGAVPVPESVTVSELAALLAKTILPATLPVTVGVNTTEYVALCPAASVLGRVRPLME